MESHWVPPASFGEGDTIDLHSRYILTFHFMYEDEEVDVASDHLCLLSILSFALLVPNEPNGLYSNNTTYKQFFYVRYTCKNHTCYESLHIL